MRSFCLGKGLLKHASLIDVHLVSYVSNMARRIQTRMDFQSTQMCRVCGSGEISAGGLLGGKAKGWGPF